MAFCDNLRELLEDRGVTQKRLAQDLKVAASTIGGYVQGTSEPDFDMLKRIARYFDVSADFLLDIHSSKADTHSEDVLLEVFRALPPRQQEIYLEQGKAAVRVLKGDCTDKEQL